MGTSILNSKISLPELREERVVRLSLLEKLQAGREKRLTLAVAGAGYGKSSLLREWAEEWIQSEKTVLWYSMDIPDRDPAVFFTYLLAGFRQHWPEMGQSIEATLNRPVPVDSEQIAVSLLIELEKALNQNPLLMVFDDYHRLDQASKIDSAMEMFLERIPPSVHIVVSSRHPVGFSTARLRADGKVNDLGEMDLRFQQNEIEALFHGIAISSELQHLIERAEGWIAALQIVLQVCQHQSLEPDRFPDMASNLSSGIYEYLAKEIFDRQPAPLQEFLLQSAILNLLVPTECDAIFERNDSAHWLEYLAEHGLFTTRLQQDMHCYRYHHLLGDFLRQKLQREVHPTQANTWHHQAATYYEEIQRWDEAFAMATQAREEGLAARIISRAFMKLRLSGQLDTAQDWLNRISQDTYRSHPLLYCHQGQIWEDRGLHDQARGAFRRAVEIAEGLNDRRALVNARTGLGIIDQRTGHLENAQESFELAVTFSSDESPAEKATALVGLSNIHLYLGHNRRARDSFRQCLELSAVIGQSAQALIMNNLGTVFTHMGEFSEALHYYTNALNLRRQMSLMPGIGICLNNIGHLHLYLGNFEAAAEVLEEAFLIGKRLSEPILSAYTLSNLGDLAAVQGDGDTAEARYKESMELKESIKDISGMVYTLTRLSEWSRRRGQLNDSFSLAQRAVELGRGKVGLNEYLPARTALGLSLLAQGRHNQAGELLDNVIETHRNTTENKYELARCLWYLAHARRVRGRSAADAPREALDLADRWNYRFLIKTLALENPELLIEAVTAGLQQSLVDSVIQDLGEVIVPALEGLLDSSEPEARLRAVEQLSRLGHEEVWQPLIKANADPNPDVQDAARAALENLQRTPPAPLYVTTLGRFTLRRGARVIPDTAWGSRQTQSLFKYLLAHQSRSVHRQDLVEMLWPELAEDGEAEREKIEKANRTLNQLIFRLRQTLEPYLPAGRGYPSRYLLNDGEAYYLELPQSSRVDEGIFEEAIAQARGAYQRGEKESAIATYQEAVDLYQGPYLVEERFLDWCIRRREELGMLAIEAFERLAEWHLAQGGPGQAVSAASRLLEIEPLHEPGYSLMMRAQYDLRLLEAARRTYQRYQKYYCKELDVPPSEEISSLYRQIRRELRKSS